MAKTALFLCALAITTSVGGTSPRAAGEDDCTNAPLDALIALPSPIRKWGQISCTPSGHVLSSRDGWVWALLESAATVGIPSQIARKNEASIGHDSYFTSIEAGELEEEEFAAALPIFLRLRQLCRWHVVPQWRLHDGFTFLDHGKRAQDETASAVGVMKPVHRRAGMY